MTTTAPRASRTRYMLQGPKGYLVDLWNGKAEWTMLPVEAMFTGNTWTTLEHATMKLKQIGPSMGDLWIAEVVFEQVTPGNPSTWRAISTRAIGRE